MSLRKLMTQLSWLGSISIAASLIIVLACALAPLLAPADPMELNILATLQPPSASHPLGTDEVGRDLLSRVLYGGRLSLLASLEVVGAAVILGGLVGILSGYMGGWLDEALMRLTDIFFAFPQLILAMAITAALGPGLFKAAAALMLVWWPGYARLFRAQALALKERQFVEAAKALGSSSSRVMARHILPNSLGAVTAKMTMDLGYAILALSGLSFIGLGAQAPQPEWGLMVALASKYALSHWWYAAIPGAAITVTVIFFTLAGDAIEDVVTA